MGSEVSICFASLRLSEGRAERLQEYGLQRYHFVHSALSDVSRQVSLSTGLLSVCVSGLDKAGTALDVVVLGTQGKGTLVLILSVG